MSNFWSNLSGIKNKAADALSKAREQIKEITEEQTEDANSEILVKAQSEIARHKKAKQDLETRYEELLATYKAKENSLVNLKIIVGSPDSPLLLEELENTQKKLSESESSVSRLQAEKERALEELSKVSVSLNQAQEFIQKQKRSNFSLINSCYDCLKESSKTIGLSIPNIRAEDIGMEDIQEFISTQTEYLKDANTRTFSALVKHSPLLTGKKLQVEPTVDSVRQATCKILDEAASRLKQANEIRSTSEDMYQKTLKHASELAKLLEEEHKKSALQTSEIKTLTSQVEDLKNKVEDVSTLKEDHKRLFEDYNLHVQRYEELQTSTQSFESIKLENTQLKQDLETNSLSLNKITQDNTAFSDEIKNLKSHANALTHKNKGMEVELIEYKNNLSKMQQVLNGLEAEVEGKTRQIDAFSEEIDTLNAQIKDKDDRENSFKEDIKQLKQQIKDEQVSKEAFESSSREELIKARSIKEEAEALLSKVDDRVNSSQNFIDKRVVGTFIVNLLSVNNSEKVKTQMLSNLANMLEFDEVQRRKVGLIEEATLFSQLANFINQGVNY